MVRNEENGLFIKFPLDQVYVEAIQNWKNDLADKRQSMSLREILEREIIKLEKTQGIISALKIDQAPRILDAPTNSARIPVRLKNQAVIESITTAAKLSNRSISKVLYTLVRIIIDNSQFAPFQHDQDEKTG